MVKDLKRILIKGSDIGLPLDLEKFCREHPNAKIEATSHEILYKPKDHLVLEQITHYYTIWYRES